MIEEIKCIVGNVGMTIKGTNICYNSGADTVLLYLTSVKISSNLCNRGSFQNAQLVNRDKRSKSRIKMM